MAGDTFTLRDAAGTEYRVEVEDSGPWAPTVALRATAGERSAPLAAAGSLLRVAVDDTTLSVVPLDGAAMRIERVNPSDEVGVARPAVTAHAACDGDTLWVFLDGRVFTFEAERAGRRRRAGTIAGSLTAPMPATVRRIETSPGKAVRRGDILVVLEAMKMELPVRAPGDGTVRRVNCREGELVQAGQELVELQP